MKMEFRNVFTIENAGQLARVVQFIEHLPVDFIEHADNSNVSTIKSGHTTIYMRWLNADIIIYQSFLSGQTECISIDFYDFQDHIRKAFESLRAEGRVKNVLDLVEGFFK